jgi:hypothetical protein
MDRIFNTINLAGWLYLLFNVGLQLYLNRDSYVQSDISFNVKFLQGVQLFQIIDIILILIGKSKGSVLGAFMQILGRNIVSLIFISA